MHANQLKRTMGIKRIALALVVAAFGYAGPASATLFDRGAGLIYDNVLNITWLQDANYAQTSGTDNQGVIDGLMNWANANAWAAGLSYFDSVRNVTYTDWRLPTALNQDGSGPCQGFNCSSEMGHMFYNNLGGVAQQDKTGNQTAAGGVTLNNIQSVYWSGAVNSGNAYFFHFDFGNQGFASGSFERSAWAVRPGDVDGVAAAVPEPASLLLIGVGVLGLALTRRRGRRR